MTDIALDKNGVMYGVTFGSLWHMASGYGGDPVLCTKLANLATSFNGLTFVPAGMGLDPVNETLVGVANNGGWWRINLSPVSLTNLGSYGAGLTSSGDAVGIIGDQIYATVNQTGFSNVRVITVNAANGNRIATIGTTSVSTATGIYGVGYWSGIMYGFAGNGRLYQIDLTNATTTLISTPTSEWWGAGVTTAAVVTPSTYVSTQFVRGFEGVCAQGTHAVWHNFEWTTVTPDDSNIVFSAQTATTQAGLSAATSVGLGTASGAPITTWTGADVSAALAPGVSRYWLRVTATLNPSTNGNFAPTLTGWRQFYDCMPDE
jgi:hypothetical protein